MKPTTKKLISNILAMDSEIDALKNLCGDTVDQVRKLKEMSKNAEDPEFELEVKKFEQFVKEVSVGSSS